MNKHTPNPNYTPLQAAQMTAVINSLGNDQRIGAPLPLVPPKPCGCGK
jgi:hypothetical protein